MAGRPKSRAKKGKHAPPPVVLRAARYPVPAGKKVSRQHGAVSSYTQETADAICERMSNGESLLQVCRDPAMPPYSTVMNWARVNEAFATQYVQARELLLDHWAQQLTDIADDGVNDYVERVTRDGNVVVLSDQENINRSRLRVDTRKWLLSKLQPKKYGEKLDLNLGGQPDGTPIQHEDIRASNLAAIEAVSSRITSGTSGTAPAAAAGEADSKPDGGSIT